MGFYDDPKNVSQYEKMCEDYDGSQIYAALDRHLEPGSSMLELGCGPGTDIAHFKRRFAVVGSDTSEEFLKRCRDRHHDTEFVNLDAVSIDVDRRFDCVFSNKVLHHLKLDDLVYSLKRQNQVIRDGGVFAHTFWIGDHEEEMHGLCFRYHARGALIDMISEYYRIEELLDYAEFEDGDSLLVIAKNGQSSDETVLL